ncbi:hypothetical protein MAM1_0346c09900 [Mucor ambiguus]|uniref:Uncharacterized protein n=1 Tax=Mucor ambiguus TaxID=91626 RepID=A0A0C9MHW3_9FUNG|nr:hypothetical protein MAM1_0346c09900 [Mucor ambiguus]
MMSTQLRSGKWLVVVTGACMLFLYLLYTITISQAQFAVDSSVVQLDAVRYIQDNQLLYTLHVQEPGRYGIAVSHQSSRWTEHDLSFFTAAGETVFSQLALIPEPGTLPNLSSITAVERLFMALFMHFDSIFAVDPSIHPEIDSRYKEAWQLLKRLESTLYPWIYPHWDNVFHMNN